MKYFIWRLLHMHSRYIHIRRGRTAYCGKCQATYNLKK